MEYTYAVARIRSKEVSLLSAHTIEQLISSKSYKECFEMLEEKGWGSGEETQQDVEQFLMVESNKAWQIVKESLNHDMSALKVFLYENDFFNLKAAIKMVYTEEVDEALFIQYGTIEGGDILRAVQEQNFDALPDHMAKAALQAYETLLHTSDGQLCDIILDKAALEAIYNAGKESKDELIKTYAELTVASSNIKIAVRCQLTGKNIDFIKDALAFCDTINTDTLARAAANSMEAIYDYLLTTDYAGAVEALQTSASEFEKWYDNLLIDKIRPQQYNSFTIGPIVAYLLARENEIKTVRIILSGKVNELPEQSIRERLREMYV